MIRVKDLSFQPLLRRKGAAWAAGRAMTLDQAIACALGEDSPPAATG